MSPQQLRETLEQLHSELARTTTVDAGARQKLEEVSADIRRLLDEDAARARESHAVHAPHLDEVAVRFEQDHPALAAAVREVADALSRVGL